jgi:MoxR-like ATPase
MFIKRRYVIPEDVRAVVHDVLRHRIDYLRRSVKIMPSVDIINKIINEVEVP